ncbi:MAG: PHP domain-containing protein [Deltaproteobacteria bacterium]|nr:PHP domain-containing protein [Deltaproteobacteria bacterium]
MRAAVALLLFIGTCTEATPPVAEPAPLPRQIGPGEPLLSGPAATGTVGDWLLSSSDGRVRVVVGDVGHREGFQATGGNLLDLSLDGQDDQIDGICTWFERTFPRQGAYTSVRTEGAALVARGTDNGDARIQVETRWEMVTPPPGVVGSLRISTTVTAPAPLPAYDLGDIVGWGGLRHFAPGPGFELKGKDVELPWVGAEGPDHAVLMLGEGPVSGPHGASWSDPVWAAPDLAADTATTYVRTLHVGGTLAGLLGATGGERRVTVQSRESTTDRPIPGAQFVVEKDGAPYVVGKTHADGTLPITLPPGEFTVRLEERGRAPAKASVIPAEATSVVALASPQGRLDVSVSVSSTPTEPGGGKPQPPGGGGEGPGPARLTFFGEGDTPTPNLGPKHHAVGGNRANIAGPSTILVPPGTYRVMATRGPWYSRAEAVVTVPEGATEELSLTLHRLVNEDTVESRWLNCDLHQHAAYSSDSAIPPVDGVIASAAEGLDCIATTEHDAVADWTEHIEEAAVGPRMLWLSGIEVTNSKEGHYNVYPFGPDAKPIGHRELDPFGIAAAIRKRAPDAVLQINHPRYGRIGVFNRLEDVTSIARLDHDALEILNGTSLDGAEEILDDVAALLGRGVHSSLVGASDSHHLVGQERGSARTFVWVGTSPSADAVARTLREEKRSVASNGPLILLRREGEEVVAESLSVDWLGPQRLSLYEGEMGGRGTEIGAPVAQGFTGPPKESLVRARVSTQATGGQWYLAVVRGDESMEPWLDTTPWAATTLVLPPSD